MKYVPWICGIGAVVSVVVAIITLPLSIWIKALLFFILFFILTGITGSMRDKDRYEEVSVDDFI